MLLKLVTLIILWIIKILPLKRMLKLEQEEEEMTITIVITLADVGKVI